MGFIQYCAFINLVICFSAAAAPQDEKAWLVCEKDADCTSVELGCIYWQAVNKKYLNEMKSKYVPVCAASTYPGPQPQTGCQKGICTIKLYTVKFWNELEVFHRNQYVDRRIKKCLEEVHIKIDMLSQGLKFVEVREPFLRKVDAEIKKNTYPSDLSLDLVMEKSLDCKSIENSFKQRQP